MGRGYTGTSIVHTDEVRTGDQYGNESPSPLICKLWGIVPIQTAEIVGGASILRRALDTQVMKNREYASV